MKDKPNISHFQEFGAPIWIFLKDIESLSKLDKQATKHFFCGYLDRPKAVRYYDTKTHHIKISCNYKFSNPAVEFNELDINMPSEGEKNGNASGTSGIQLTLPQTPSQHIPAKPTPESETSALPSKQASTPKQIPPSTPRATTEHNPKPNQLNPIPLWRLTREVKDHNYLQLGNPNT
jgi:hypothetical protein